MHNNRLSARRSLIPIAAAFVLGGLILPNLRVSWVGPSSQAQTGTSGLGVSPSAPQPLSQEEVYARAAQAVYKAVVNIDRTQRVRVRGFFDDEYVDGPRFREARNSGSGVIISKDGYILTNEHVVGGRDEAGKSITVTMTDGRKLQGTVIGADHETDVALIKVEDNNLPAATMGTSQGLTPGQMAVAIGNPLGLRFTVSHGVVSALGRPVTIQDRIYRDLIQHDALINPGNSGGALVDIHGQLIGINTLVAQEAQGIGFAIPIDTALKVADELKRNGKVKRPWIGCVVTTNDAFFVQRYGLPDVRGVVVRGVYRGGPAAEGGIEAGDVITKINGQPVRSEEEFRTVERRLKIGDKVEVELHRQDTRASGSVTVGEAP
jgi:serine protease Do